MIESVKNEKVKYWSKLKDKKYQMSEELFLVEGSHLVEEANRANVLKEVIILNDYKEEFKYKNANYVNEYVMKKISSLKSVPKIIGVCKYLESDGVSGNVLLLDGIQDPGNLGTIIRSAVAFNVGTLILGSGTVSIYNPKVLRASAGMVFHLNILEAKLEKMLPLLKEDGYKIYSTNVVDGKELSDIKFPKKTAIIIGNEGNGVNSIIDSYKDESLYIKMDESCESLNAGVATSIILYELNK